MLRAKARPIERSEITRPTTQRLINDMIETMVDHGVGLAAPQVHESVRLFVIAGLEYSADDPDAQSPVAIINPEITVVGSEGVEDWEVCLSIPDIRGRVPRAKEILLRAFDRQGDRIELVVRDYWARVVQHETDHLDGILFFDRMRTFESLTFLDDIRGWAKDD